MGLVTKLQDEVGIFAKNTKVFCTCKERKLQQLISPDHFLASRLGSMGLDPEEQADVSRSLALERVPRIEELLGKALVKKQFKLAENNVSSKCSQVLFKALLDSIIAMLESEKDHDVQWYLALYEHATQLFNMVHLIPE